jgi:hypothetical protein
MGALAKIVKADCFFYGFLIFSCTFFLRAIVCMSKHMHYDVLSLRWCNRIWSFRISGLQKWKFIENCVSKKDQKNTLVELSILAAKRQI